mmetsp:Transcript_23520/g.54426  ORF Transcript_23520/g.54426 Transcript_23520/m.54426 type:complete len:212 (-) Transcript_23520:288-923(-)
MTRHCRSSATRHAMGRKRIRRRRRPSNRARGAARGLHFPGGDKKCAASSRAAPWSRAVTNRRATAKQEAQGSAERAAPQTGCTPAPSPSRAAAAAAAAAASFRATLHSGGHGRRGHGRRRLKRCLLWRRRRRTPPPTPHSRTALDLHTHPQARGPTRGLVRQRAAGIEGGSGTGASASTRGKKPGAGARGKSVAANGGRRRKRRRWRRCGS